MAVGVAAFGYQFANGLVVTGMRNIVMWGQYILFFMFFVGLSAGGLIVASAGRLFGVKAFKPITRLAVLEATVAVILAATFILPDLGRPERILNIPLYFNPTSPMVWDISIVMVYMATVGVLRLALLPAPTSPDAGPGWRWGPARRSGRWRARSAPRA